MVFRKWVEDSESWRFVERIEAKQSITNVCLFFNVHCSVISQLWIQFQTSWIVVRRLVASHPRVTTSAEDRYIDTIAKRNRRSTFIRLASMVAATIRKTVSATTIRWRLHMNCLHVQEPQICVPLFVQSEGARLKWYCFLSFRFHNKLSWTTSVINCMRHFKYATPVQHNLYFMQKEKKIDL